MANAQTDKKQDAVEAYLKEAQSWESDINSMREKSEKRAWRVAYAAGTFAFVALIGIAALAPLKEVTPFLVRVDNTTGIVDIVTAIVDGKTTYEEAINSYFLRNYIRYREAYSYSLAEEYYVNVGAMSAPEEQKKYFEYFNPKNPDSPLKVYGQNVTVEINVDSTSYIKPDVALVRWHGIERRPGEKPLLSHWASTLTFRYVGTPMKKKDREISPLGFQVTEYRRDSDSSIQTQLPISSQQVPVSVSPAPQNDEVVLFPGQIVQPNAATQSDDAGQ